MARDFHGVQGILRINLKRDSDSSPHREQVKSKKSNLHETMQQTQEADRCHYGPMLVYHSAAAAANPFGSRRLLSSACRWQAANPDFPH